MDIVTFFLIWICWGAIHGVFGIKTMYDVKYKKENGLEPETKLESKLFDTVDEFGIVIKNPYNLIAGMQFLLALLIGPFGTALWFWGNVYTMIKG